jgi:hypothetical protein
MKQKTLLNNVSKIRDLIEIFLIVQFFNFALITFPLAFTICTIFNITQFIIFLQER